MSTAHTPGPWMHNGLDDAKDEFAFAAAVYARNEHTFICSTITPAHLSNKAPPVSEQDANARLIAKAPIAPKLAEALRKAYRELNEIRARDGVPHTFDGIRASVDEEYFGEVVDECRAALAEWDALP